MFFSVHNIFTGVEHRPASNLSIALDIILSSVCIRLANIITVLVIASVDETWPVCYINDKH